MYELVVGYTQIQSNALIKAKLINTLAGPTPPQRIV